MGLPAAKQGDQVVAVDLHIVIMPDGTPLSMPHPFAGLLQEGLSPDVTIMGRPAAVVGSVARATVPHVPAPPGTAFAGPPGNTGTVSSGSPTVKINGKPAARAGDPAITCNDPVDQPVGQVVAAGTVFIGGGPS